MSRYLLVVTDNRIADVTPLADEDEEYLGIEWALSEIKDSYRFSGAVNGSFSLASKDELIELVAFLEQLLGEDAVDGAGAKLDAM